jgi:hypothetical protein
MKEIAIQTEATTGQEPVCANCHAPRDEWDGYPDEWDAFACTDYWEEEYCSPSCREAAEERDEERRAFREEQGTSSYPTNYPRPWRGMVAADLY